MYSRLLSRPSRRKAREKSVTPLSPDQSPTDPAWPFRCGDALSGLIVDVKSRYHSFTLGLQFSMSAKADFVNYQFSLIRETTQEHRVHDGKCSFGVHPR